ncbi:EAL domain-containing protein [Halomonas sp. Bachu 37]|uniref:bifunctional diguanylate cyclase/phosphodiesterase n=1 Tax=Halomonas kashgarensis TaxID=3084920 RepID=UPI00321685B2
MTQRPLANYLTGLIWLCVLPLVVLSVWWAFDSVHARGQEIREEAQQLSHNTTRAIDHYLDSRIRALSVLAASPLADTQERWPQLYAEAQAFRASFGSHVAFSDLGDPMRMRFNTRAPYGSELPPLPRPSGEAAAPKALETGQPAIGDSFMGPVANETLAAIVVPGIRENRVTHLVIATLEASQLQQRLDSLVLPAGWTLALTDSHGERLAQRGLPNDEGVEHEEATEQFQVSSAFSPWQVTLSVPRSALTDPRLKLAISLALLIATATLGGVLGGHYAARRLSRHMAALADPALRSSHAPIREITEIRQLLDERATQLRASEALHRELFEANPHPMWVFSLDTLAFLEVNAAAVRQYGYSRDDFMRMTIKDIRPAEDIPRLLAGVALLSKQTELSDQAESIDKEELWRHVTRDGRHLDVEIHSHIMNYEGQPAHLVLAHDITDRLRAEAALRDSEAEFRTLIETMPQIIWVTRPDGWHLLYNQHWFDFTGLTLEESLGHGWNPAFHPEDRARAVTRWEQATASGELYEIEYRLRRADGNYRWMLGRALPLRDSSGQIVKWFGTCTDIHELKHTERILMTRAHQQVLVAEFGRLALVTTDIDKLSQEAATIMADGLGVSYTKVLLCDEPDKTCTFAAGVGWSPAWIGRKIHRGNHSFSQIDYALDSMEPVIIANLHDETRFSTSPLLIHHQIVSGINVVIQGIEGPLGILGAYSQETRQFSTDDTGFLQSIANTLSTAIERRLADDRLTYVAHHDTLTSLPNRFLLTDRLSMALADAQRHGRHLAVLFLNVDRFKNVNDIHGRAFGDQVLKEIAKRLRVSARVMDTVSRQGGDEFLMILPELHDYHEAQQIAQKILASFAPPFHIDDSEVVLSGSIGIACYPADGQDVETLMRNADAAMHVAKERGCSRYQCYAADMHARTIEHLMLEGDLRRAIESDQLFLEYQPQFDLTHGTIIGMEVLVRWLHPKHGLVSPCKFIPIAEESGQIVAIGSWILEQACEQYTRWTADGLDIGTIAVNVSAYQFQHPDFVDMVEAVLKRTGLAAEYLELEVTESVVMQDMHTVQDKLNRLHALGIKLAIDDFGTGYSSLSYLTQIPLHRLKIDQSFTAGLLKDRESLAITQAIIHMGHSLGLDVLAEGVKTVDQETQLRAMACNAGQGYLYAKPLSAEDITTFVRRRTQEQIT